jgi:hypothetical protein
MADFVVEVGLEGRVGWADDFLRPAFRASPIRGGRSDALEALTLQSERHAHATHAADVIGGGRATSLASRLRFCAMAASVNSNCADVPVPDQYPCATPRPGSSGACWHRLG